MRGTRVGRRWVGVAVLGLVAAVAGGCMHAHAPLPHPHHGGPPRIEVPPPGTVPAELVKIVLPPYVIEAPDNLLIQVIQRATVPDMDEKTSKQKVDPVTNDKLTREETKPLPIQPIDQTFLVRLDGTVSLGFWGSVPVAGLTLEQAAEAIRQHVVQNETLRKYKTQPESLVVIVDVVAYNSKKYYVITDGGGYGEQVTPFPIYGSETVLDAIGNINGLPAVASKRNIWVARRCPNPDQQWQILPVDWVGITQHGHTTTNYQIMPGDRIYVKAQKLVTIDTALARIISPIERIFGVTLLGASTVNNIQGRGQGFGGTQ